MLIRILLLPVMSHALYNQNNLGESCSQEQKTMRHGREGQSLLQVHLLFVMRGSQTFNEPLKLDAS